MQKEQSLYVRFKRVEKESYNLSPDEVLGFVDVRFEDLTESRKALRIIKKRYLNNEELILLELKTMRPVKSDSEIADIMGISPQAVHKKKNALYRMIASYGWWIANEKTCRGIVLGKLGALHWLILISVVYRRPYRKIAKKLNITYYSVYRKMHDNKKLLRTVPEFKTFLKNLKHGYYKRIS